MGIMASQEQTVEQLFGAALDRRPEDRRAFLDRVCAGAPELRERVEELLLADEQAGSFLERSPRIFAARQSDTTKFTQETNGGYAYLPNFGSASASRFEPGQLIAGRFVVIRFIDRGGMGEVYEVEDHFLQGVHVALKVILPHIANDAESAHRFKREVLLARKAAHRNLCPIYDIAHCEVPPPPFLFLTMKLLSGETLASRLKKVPPLYRSEVISIFRQMTAGLAAIHAAGVVHGDIKPKNVMLDHSGSDLCVSIMDFGLARLYASQTTVFTRGSIAGTPGYIAPELLRGEPPSQATDIFALGVLFQQVLTGDPLNVELEGLSVKPSTALDVADVPPLFIHSVKEFLSDDPLRRCHVFEQIQSAFESGGDLAARKLIDFPDNSHRSVLSRRKFIAGSAVTAFAAAGGIVWKWDTLTDRVNDLLHPLPLKRFVALLNWPASDARIKPILEGVIDAIGSELARAEAFDRDLLVISPTVSTNLTSAKQLDKVRETLGANLVLAASGLARGNDLHLSLSVLDPSSGRSLREKSISWPLSEPITLPEKAVRAAAELLDLNRYRQIKNAAGPVTQSSQAYAAFQAAEADMKLENDTGLSAAIDKYKEAIELDLRYATAYAQLAWAYLHLYTLRGDPAALSLGRNNCDTALSLNPNLIVARLALSFVLEQTGDNDAAAREIAKALSIDPDDPRTLVLQGQLFARLNRWVDAEDSFKRAIKRRPNLWLPHDELGVVYNAEGKYPQAVEEFRAATLLVPMRAWPLNNLASVYLQQGKVGEAKATAKRSLDLNFNDSAATTMAAALRCEGKAEDAIPFSLKAVELNPAEAGNWLELGDCYALVHGRRSEALKAYSGAAGAQEDELKDDPKNGPGWMVLGLCRIKAGSPHTAPDLIAKAERVLAADLDSQLRKARALELLGERDEALATVEACLKRGATQFQIQTMPDMESLRDDFRYTAFIKSMPPTTETDL
jgi:serine/threonine protein kinase/tetratricopeptide (TPR) repeat protein